MKDSTIDDIIKEINQSKDDRMLKGLFDFIDGNKEVIEVKEDEMARPKRK